SAYVSNDAQGTVTRIDGATYKRSQPIQFGDATGSALRLFTGGQALYVVDGQRRTASVTDPVTLQVRKRLSLTAEPGPDQSVVDSAGRLWVVDRQRGGLTWFDGDKRVRPDAADARARLVLVQGRPVLVDAARSRLGRLTADGMVERWSCLELRSGDKAQLLGSSSGPRVYAAVPATGMLVVSGVGRDECGLAVEVGQAGNDFGPLVESGGFVFVPNRTSGRTVVVDVAAGRVVADLEVVKRGARLELLAKDGFVFYNDLDSDRAGVIKFDGGQWRLGETLQKFDVSDTGRGILTPDDEDDPPKDQPTEPEKPGEKPGRDPRPDPPGENNPPVGPQPPPPPVGPQPPPPPPPDDGPVPLTVEVSGGGSVFAESPAPVGLPAGTECPGSCLWRYPVGTQVTLRVPESAAGANLAALDGCDSTDSAGGNRTCVLTLTEPRGVRAVFEAQQPVTVILTATRQGNGTLSATPAGGTTTSCDPTCSIDVVVGTQVTLSANAAAGHEVTGWTGVSGCGARGTCTFPVNTNMPVSVEFARVFQLAVLMRGQGAGTVSGQGLSCDGKGCTGRYREGTVVELTANPGARSAFAGWSGCSPAGSRTCTVRMDDDKTVTVTFDVVPDTTPPDVRLSANGVTVTPNSGRRTLNISGANTSVSMTATGTDGGSDVTNTSVIYRFSFLTCETADGGDTTTKNDDGFDLPVASSPDGSVSVTRNINRCPESFPVLVSAEAQYMGRATSEGGTAQTDSLVILYTR
ncbi:MAG TPA: hypothetical protein VFR67_06760, partial [Pilimelia sp.]|nr:hypothetical protein [Pilimelia sp.]